MIHVFRIDEDPEETKDEEAEATNGDDGDTPTEPAAA